MTTLTEKSENFINFAKKKNWDASLMYYDGAYMAILNPTDKPGVFQGRSSESMDAAIELAKKEYLKSKGR